MSAKSSEARAYAFQFLYHIHLPNFEKEKSELWEEQGDEFLQSELEEFEVSYANPDKEFQVKPLTPDQKKLALTLIEGTLKNYKSISELIDKHSTKWKQEQMNRVDLAILYLGTFELKFHAKAPEKVILNEMINLAKNYGTESSYSFVNGLLDVIRKN